MSGERFRFGIDLPCPDGNARRTLYWRLPFSRWRTIKVARWSKGTCPRFERWLDRHGIWPQY